MRVLVLSPRVPAGLMTASAWDSVRSAPRVVAAVESPQVDALRDAGVEVTIGAVPSDPAAVWVPEPGDVSWARTVSLHEPFVWVVLISTFVGLGLSFTRARTLEGAGASNIGTLLLYFLIASIGMQMDIIALFDRPWLYLLGLVWLAIHILLLWLVGGLLKVPFFYFAIGSQSNIGGPASAPVVASAFHPALTPVGALLGALGYATGTGLAWVLGITLKSLAGA